MERKIAVGGEDFIALRQSGRYYVDKTQWLYELVEKNNNAVTLFTRPRRFGKTLTMSMIESFFSIFKKDSRDVFNGLNIMNHSDFCDKYMNQYPVLFISFKDIEGLNFDDAYDMMLSLLAYYCKKMESFFSSDKVNSVDREIFRNFMCKKVKKDDVKFISLIIL